MGRLKVYLSTWIYRGCFLIAILLGSGAQARAQLLDYNTFAGYGLGKGFLANDLSQPLPACITATQTKLPASHADVRVSISYSSSDYEQAFHIDQSAQASYLKLASGSDTLHIGRETSSSGSLFDIIVEAYGEHDSDTLGNIKWDPPYDQLIATGDPAKIQTVRAACGDRFIETVFNETRLFLVMHVSSQHESSSVSNQFTNERTGRTQCRICKR
jgi:hypothetical protein